MSFFCQEIRERKWTINSCWKSSKGIFSEVSHGTSFVHKTCMDIEPSNGGFFVHKVVLRQTKPSLFETNNQNNHKKNRFNKDAYAGAMIRYSDNFRLIVLMSGDALCGKAPYHLKSKVKHWKFKPCSVVTIRTYLHKSCPSCSHWDIVRSVLYQDTKPCCACTHGVQQKFRACWT